MTTANATDYTTVTERPGGGATREQIAMLYTRYALARRLAKGKDVLEVACGCGPGLGYLARQARRVVGGDLEQSLLDTARDTYGDRVELRRFDAHELPFDDGSFDVLLLLEAVYYLEDPARFVREARRVLGPGGSLLIASANREWTLFNPSPFSRRYFSAAELKRLLESEGFAAEVFAGFPDAPAGLSSRVKRAVRKAAVSLNLIPKTMEGKERFKRLFYGALEPLPAELGEGEGEADALTPVTDDAPVTGHKVLYAVGTAGAVVSGDVLLRGLGSQGAAARE